MDKNTKKKKIGTLELCSISLKSEDEEKAKKKNKSSWYKIKLLYTFFFCYLDTAQKEDRGIKYTIPTKNVDTKKE